MRAICSSSLLLAAPSINHGCNYGSNKYRVPVGLNSEGSRFNMTHTLACFSSGDNSLGVQILLPCTKLIISSWKEAFNTMKFLGFLHFDLMRRFFLIISDAEDEMKSSNHFTLISYSCKINLILLVWNWGTTVTCEQNFAWHCDNPLTNFVWQFVRFIWQFLTDL